MQGKPLNSPESGDDPDGQEKWEIKPAVKYAGIGVAMLLLVGVEYATYTFGYESGCRDTKPSASATAQAELNATAVANLTHFMQLATESDDVLLDTVANFKQKLSWIRDPRVQKEAQWSLAQALMDRGKVGATLDMLSQLFPQVEVSTVWAHRAVCVAQALAEEGRTEDALSYYRFATGQYATLNRPEERLQTISAQVELLASATAATPEVMVPLEALQQEAAATGELGKALRADILAYMGTLYRASGDSAKALQCFEQALAGVDGGQTPELASASVCYGMALLEKGEAGKAEQFLRDGVTRLGDSPSEASFLVAGLRELARLEHDHGNTEEALGLLYRAEGAAMGRIPAGNPFWPMLYDQRGWINLDKKLYDSAAKDFIKAAKDKHHPELQGQPAEGAARCLLALGKGQQALQYLEKAVSLRRQHQPEAKADLGRLYLLMGHAHDLVSGHAESAAQAYSQAVEYLPEGSPDRRGAMMCLGYALNQASRWAEAAKVWEALLAGAKDDAALRQEVQGQLTLCRRHGASAHNDGGEENGTEADTPARPSLLSPPTRRRRR